MKAMDKKALRESMLQLRSDLPADRHRLHSAEVCRRLTEFIETLPLSAASLVLVYFPFPPEVDIRPAVERLWERGIRTAAPVVMKKSRRLEWRQVSGYEDLLPGTWGILEPRMDCPLIPDVEAVAATLILVPGLAFDPCGGRLGYGGGYYDRFLGQVMAEGRRQEGQRAVKLAAAFDFQLVPCVPAEEHDCPVDVQPSS